VRGEIDGFAIRTSLLPEKGTGRTFLLVNKKMQAATKLRAGAKVRITLEPDLEERPAEMPPELERVMKGDRLLRRWFEKLGLGMRKWIGDWVTQPKSIEARRNRAERTAEWLMLVMEGEMETPPILKAAFLRHPLARAGWEAMTQAQRRRHLLGIFHLQGVEARERRVEAAIEDAIRVSRKEPKRKRAEPKETGRGETGWEEAGWGE
jgi:uncharacterized protein YdeI (YjbR/CyaY-like superfamily)